MSGAAFLRVKKLKGGGIITAAARHNRRVIQAEMGATGAIDPTRSCLNETLAGPPAADDVGQLAKALMAAAGVVKLRKDAVLGLEVVFSLPPGHGTDDRAYFTACAEWAGAAFDGAPVLSADIHRDEAAPHCHVLLLPLVNSRMDGSNLIGGKQKLLMMQKDFHLKVAAKFGLSKAPARLSGTAKQAAAKAVLQHLRETADPALKSPGWPAYRDAIETAPGPFLLAYGLELATPKSKLRTFTQIMTSKGKGPAREKEPNPIGFTLASASKSKEAQQSASKAPSAKDQTLCSVGFTQKLAVSPPPRPAPRPTRQAAIERPQLQVDMDEVRVRDNDLDPALYDLDTGEYFAPPPRPTRHARQAADAWVASALTAKMTVGLIQQQKNTP